MRKIILAVLLAAALGLLMFYFGAEEEDAGRCPADAKICADGSTVLRTGPDCEFAECPLTGEIQGGIRCSLEAKICPDGSGVGRTGPNCEFAKCPGEE